MRRLRLRSAPRLAPVRIEPAEARRLVSEGAVLLDVRKKDESLAPLPHALRIEPDEIPARLGELPQNGPILLTCT
jgi:rhodanese-related sulfurtransferase